MTEDSERGERIAKVIARSGLASRREAEQWIAAGRVALNGTPVRTPAVNVTTADRVLVDGEPLPERERTRLFRHHKPRGLLTSHADPQGRPTIFQRLPKHLPRLISVGRLDFNTEGLILLTNDGALARLLELPATGWLRRYRVRAHGAVTQAKLDELRAGVTIEGVRYGAIEALIDRVQGSNLWLTFAIREGKNREVRNVLGHLGLTVTRLIRIGFGPFELDDLAEGAVEEVPTRELRQQLGAHAGALSQSGFSAPVAARPPRAAGGVTRTRSGTREAPAGRGYGKGLGKDSAKGSARIPADRQGTWQGTWQGIWQGTDEAGRSKSSGAFVAQCRSGAAAEKAEAQVSRFKAQRRKEPREAAGTGARGPSQRPQRPQRCRRAVRAATRPRPRPRGAGSAMKRGRFGRQRSPDRASGARPKFPRGR